MAQPDELIDFHHLKSRRGMSQLELEDEVATDLQKATGLVDTHTTDSSHLNRVLQLTGVPVFRSEPVLQTCAHAHLSSQHNAVHGGQFRALHEKVSTTPISASSVNLKR